MSDTDIALHVLRSLALVLEDIDAVRVEVEQDVVYLEGVAVDAAQKQRIGEIAGQVTGVRRVVNCLSLEHVAHLNAAANDPHPGRRVVPGGADLQWSDGSSS